MVEILKKEAKFTKIGKEPVVIFPIKIWNTMNERIEMLEEYYSMGVSKKYKKDIALARKSKNEISSNLLYKKLGLI
jgi:hypothetical protein